MVKAVPHAESDGQFNSSGSLLLKSTQHLQQQLNEQVERNDAAEDTLARQLESSIRAMSLKWVVAI